MFVMPSKEQASIWLEVNLANIGHNLNLARQLLNKNTEIMCILKADAYGHGAVTIAKYLISKGINHLGVGSIEEAIWLRQNDINVDILILGFVEEVNFEYLFEYQLTPSLYLLNHLALLNNMAKKRNTILNIHLRVDTGMGSFGILPQDAFHFFSCLKELANLNLKGIYTHLNAAYGDNKKLAYPQLAIFNAVLENYSKYVSLKNVLVHAASSPNFAIVPEAEYNMVRLGIMLYGLRSNNSCIDESLKVATCLKTKIVQIKEVDSNYGIGYNWEYISRQAMRIATLPIGYADARFLYSFNGGKVIVRGENAEILCRGFMDHLIIDISHLPTLEIGEEVLIWGQEEKGHNNIEEIAKKVGINRDNCEILTLLGNRVLRHYAY